MEWAHLMFLVVLVVSMLHSCADAQAGTTSNPPMGITLRDNLKATMSVMLVAFLSAFLFMGFFSLYLRHCSYGYGAANRNPIAAASDLCRRGFNRQVIDKCPVLAYSVVKDLKIGKGSLECAVCLSEFQDCDNIRLLPKCHHVFHLDCIDAWLLSHMNCPVCRARLTPDVADDIAIPITALASPSNNEHNPTTAPEQSGHEMEHNNLEEGQSSTVTGSGVAVTAEADTDSTALAAQNLIIPPRESRMMDRFPRSHSTGHSLAEPEENIKVVDRYTLRLPERVREHILANHGWVRRLPTSDVVLPGAWSSKTACYRGNYDNVERWSLSLTPPSASLSYYGWGDDLVHNDNLRSQTTCWTPLRMPFYRVQGPQKPSPIPPV